MLLLYNSLKSCNRANEFERIYGNMNATRFYSRVACRHCPEVFLAFQLGFTFNYWLSFISSILAVAFFFAFA
jgi:hypothetical protein